MRDQLNINNWNCKAYLFAKMEDSKSGDEEKIVIYFKNIGNAPVLAKEKVTLLKSHNVASLYKFLEKKLKSQLEDSNQKILLQISESFIPSQQTLLADLYDTFKNDSNMLVVSFSIDEPGWG